MIDRINLILKAKNLTSRQFAEEIGIQPSGMSHILSGRNRPSLDFVMKVVTRYPEIDIKWLTLGEGEMYVSPYSMPVNAVVSAPRNNKPVGGDGGFTVEPVEEKHVELEPEPKDATLFDEPDLFSQTEPAPVSEVRPQPNDQSEPAEVRQEAVEAQSLDVAEEPAPAVQREQPSTPQLNENRVYDLPKPAGVENKNLVKKRIKKVVILYDDHSFSEYYPED